MAIQDILIVVDCVRQSVQMYAADPGIVQSNSQGTNELWVKVPADTVLRWRAVPLQMDTGSDSEPELYHVIISSFKLWGAGGGTPPQGDASLYLKEWGTSNGEGDAPYYSSTGNIAPNTTLPVGTEGINRPFVQTTAQLTNRDETQGPKVAYSFTVDVYKNRTKVATINWDPFVTVYRE
jgi:hypothetical protein